MARFKIGTRTSGPGTQELPQSEKVGPWTSLSFKIGTPGTPSSVNVGTPHLYLMKSFFSEHFIFCFTYLIFLSFLNKIQKSINGE